MTEIGVGYLSALRRLCVGHIVGPLGLVVMAASGAPASAWETFEARCLVPMENLERPKTEDLFEVENDYSEVEGTRAFVNADRTFILWTGVSAGTGGDFCTLLDIHYSEMDGSDVSFDAWANRQIKTGRYVDVSQQDPHAPITFQSTEWREPRIEVGSGWYAASDGPSLSVRETDLES